MLEIIFHCLLNARSQRLLLGCLVKVLPIVVSSGVVVWLGNKSCCVHAACSSLCISCSKKTCTLSSCACPVSSLLNSRRKVSLLGTVCKYQLACLRAILGPMNSP